MILDHNNKILITGAAGLVGQNLILLLSEQGYKNIIAIDKRKENSEILRNIHHNINVVTSDLSIPGDWNKYFARTEIVIILHAHIGSEVPEEYVNDNVTATKHVLAACKKHNVPYIIHISSSVVNSLVSDDYTETKKQQEELVCSAGINFCVLRPTLMFGWFDRKHLGWLARFMGKMPVFPIPGNGLYKRQPLYVRDFCKIILFCILNKPNNKIYNITGKDTIYYIDLIQLIKRITKSKCIILKIPYNIFWFLLKIVCLIFKHPPFTTKQLEALITPDSFELIPWWKIFNVKPTNLEEAITETFTDHKWSKITLKF